MNQADADWLVATVEALDALPIPLQREAMLECVGQALHHANQAALHLALAAELRSRLLAAVSAGVLDTLPGSLPELAATVKEILAVAQEAAEAMLVKGENHGR